MDIIVTREMPRRRPPGLSDRERIRRAAYVACGVDMPLPLVRADGKLLGMLRGHGDRDACDFVPAQAAPYNSYDNYVDQLTRDPPRRSTFIYEKNANANPNATSWYDMWPLAGNPTQGTYPGAARTAVQWDDTATGALWHGGNVAPLEKYVLSDMPVLSGSIGHVYMLYDRVLTYEACTMTAGSQAMVNVLAAQRYVATGQPGLRMAMTGQTAHNGTAANLTVFTYVDNNGNSVLMPTTPTVEKNTTITTPSLTTGAKFVVPMTTQITRSPFIPNAVGSTGARSVVDYTWSAAPTGTFCLVLCYPLAWVSGVTATAKQILDTVNSIGGPSRVYDGACPAMFWYSLTGAIPARSYIFGDFAWTST